MWRFFGLFFYDLNIKVFLMFNEWIMNKCFFLKVDISDDYYEGWFRRIFWMFNLFWKVYGVKSVDLLIYFL